MGAGGVADPIQGDSEEFGASAPRKERVGDDEATESTTVDTSSQPSGPKRQKTSDGDVSSSKKGSASLGSEPSKGQKSNSQGGSDELEQISREKAEKYVNLDEDEVNISSATSEQGKRQARADRRADAVGESKSAGSNEAKKHGGHADVEELHGIATLGSGSGSGKRDQEGQKKGESKGSAGEENGSAAQEGHDLDQIQRRQAEKFGAVNLEK